MSWPYKFANRGLSAQEGIMEMNPTIRYERQGLVVWKRLPQLCVDLDVGVHCSRLDGVSARGVPAGPAGAPLACSAHSCLDGCPFCLGLHVPLCPTVFHPYVVPFLFNEVYFQGKKG